MKKKVVILALLTVPSIAFAGNARLYLLQNTTNATAITFCPTGGSLVVNVWLDTTAADAPEGIANIVGNLTSYASDGVTPKSGIFTMVRRDTAGCGPFTTGDTWDVTQNGTAIAGALSPNSKSIGVAATGGFGDGPAGNYMVPTTTYVDGNDVEQTFTVPWKLMKLTLAVAGVPGSYVLGFSPGTYVGTTTGNGVYPAALTTTLQGMSSGLMTVDVTPEPATMLLLAAAVPALRRRRA